MVSELKILGVILDSKLSFEKQVRAIAASASMRVGILRKTMSVFRDVTVVTKCFWAFILPVLDAATSHLSLLDSVVSQVGRLSSGSVSCNLWHRRKVASLSVFFKIDSLVDHPVRDLFPDSFRAVCVEETNPCSLGCSLSILRDVYLGLELCSFRALLFCLVFDCGMGCMSLSLLVKFWVLLKLQSIAFFYKVDCPLFLPSFNCFSFIFPFLGT